MIQIERYANFVKDKEQKKNTGVILKFNKQLMFDCINTASQQNDRNGLGADRHLAIPMIGKCITGDSINWNDSIIN